MSYLNKKNAGILFGKDIFVSAINSVKLCIDRLQLTINNFLLFNSRLFTSF